MKPHRVGSEVVAAVAIALTIAVLAVAGFAMLTRADPAPHRAEIEAFYERQVCDLLGRNVTPAPGTICD